MNTRAMSRSLFLAGLLALCPLAGAQPDQRQFTSDKPMEPFPPPESGQTEAAAPVGEGGTEAAAVTTAEVTEATGDQGFGAETRAWTELQASGSAATGDARPMPGEVADAVYQRYVNSFKHPIPQQFQQTSGSEGSSGSGGGSGSSK